jgi:hypothetical protein
MTITRDVITDLLPLYLAGEASSGTKALIESYLRDNPEFASTIRQATERGEALLGFSADAPSPDHEKATLERVRRFNRRRTILLALAWGFALTVLAFSFQGQQIRWVMLRDSPVQALIFTIASFACLAAYLSMGRKLHMKDRD